jgi:hypothetical protein
VRPKFQDDINALSYRGISCIFGRLLGGGDLLGNQVGHPLRSDIVAQLQASNDSLAELDDCIRAIE